MPNGPQGQKYSVDVIGSAIKVARLTTGETIEDLKEPLGRVRGGTAGPEAWAESMTQEERSAVVKQAAARVGHDAD